ncbi:MAG: lysophospholipid acyltransferase family protein [Pseudomonadota bacterium]
MTGEKASGGEAAGAPRRMLAQVLGHTLSVALHFLFAPRALWHGTAPMAEQRVYFANHASNGDFAIVWAVLPHALRRRTRPVAAADYWRGLIRRFVARDVFNAVLIERRREKRSEDPVEQMSVAIHEGATLLIFPEGGRSQGGVLPFKTGLYHLARLHPGVPLVPVWIDNLNRVLPKGEIVPVPLLCTVTFGAPIHLGDGEAKDAFLTRARDALLATRPTDEDCDGATEAEAAA